MSFLASKIEARRERLEGDVMKASGNFQERSGRIPLGWVYLKKNLQITHMVTFVYVFFHLFVVFELIDPSTF